MAKTVRLNARANTYLEKIEENQEYDRPRTEIVADALKALSAAQSDS